MALTNEWMLGTPNWNRCCYCGTETAGGGLDALGRYRCDGCRDRWAAATEATRLAAVGREVSERASMWCLPPLDGA